MTVAAIVNRFVGNSCNLFCVITSVIVWWPLSTDSLLRDHICHCVVAVVNRFVANTITVWSHVIVWWLSSTDCHCVVAVVNRFIAVQSHLSLCGGCCQQIVIVWWLLSTDCHCVVAVVNRFVANSCSRCCVITSARKWAPWWQRAWATFPSHRALTGAICPTLLSVFLMEPRLKNCKLLS